MDFLVIIAGMLVLYLCQTLSWIQRDRWYYRFVKSLYNILKSQSVWVYLVSLLIPVVAILALDFSVSSNMYGLTGYFLGLFVLLYTFGRGNLGIDVDAYRDALKRDDMQAAYHESSAFVEARHESSAKDWQQLHNEVTANVAYRYFEHYFVVIFWYLLGGPAGALLYRLAQLHLDGELDQAESRAAARRFLWILEWLPVRLFGITLALVGNFASCLVPWLESLLDFHSKSSAVMAELVCGALDVDYLREVKGAKHTRDVLEISAIQALLHRALICTLCLVALLIIFV